DVELADGAGVRQLEATCAVVLATGSTSVKPEIAGLRDMKVWDSRGATSSQAVPERLLVLGGGPVGVEMAQAWKRLGSREVTIVDRGPRLLKKFQPFASEELRAAFADDGIEVVLDATVDRVTRAGDDGEVTLTLHEGRTFTADELLVA